MKKLGPPDDPTVGKAQEALDLVSALRAHLSIESVWEGLDQLEELMLYMLRTCSSITNATAHLQMLRRLRHAT